MSEFPYLTEAELRQKAVDIVFKGIRFKTTPGSVLNIRYKTGEQVQAGSESTDSEINKERTIFPTTIILDKNNSSSSMERFIFKLQALKTISSLYIVENGSLHKNMFIASISRPFELGSLILIDIEFMERAVGEGILFNDTLNLPGARKQKKSLSKREVLNNDIWAEIATIPR